MTSNIIEKLEKVDKRLLIGLVFCFSFLCHLGFIGRNYSSDEGLFLLCYRMAMDGILPVLDYFSKDAPYFMFIYGGVLKLFGFNIYVARIFTYFSSSIIGVFVYMWINKTYQRKDVALVGTGLCMTSILYLFEGSPLSAVGHTQLALLFLFISLMLSSVSLELKQFDGSLAG